MGESGLVSVEETLHLMGIPGMEESLIEDRDEPVEGCVDESALEW